MRACFLVQRLAFADGHQQRALQTPAASLPSSRRQGMNYGGCCFELSIVCTSESLGFFCWLVLISDRFSCDSADGPRLVLYLGVIRITWRAFQHTWGPLPWGQFRMERSGWGHTCAQSSLDPSSLLLGVRESTLNWSSVQTVTTSIVLRFFITPFHLLILVPIVHY